jgi:superfamily II DNA or RNA helicase
MKTSYRDFIASKASAADCSGLAGPFDFPDGMFPFQSDLSSWGLRRGRAALFSDTGTGKTLMQCAMAREVSRRVGNTLILAPLAVAEQTVSEAARFGIEVVYAREFSGASITITNYDIVDRFNPDDFTCVILDESSILKSCP